ncbi:MAG TPA: hypothetical protein VM431_03710 [Phycisphaerae bacterium]|nr:hypothetical protein [Phycisphaerae bacterium]
MPTRTRKRTPKGHQAAAPAAVVKAVAEAKARYAGLTVFETEITPSPADVPQPPPLVWLEEAARMLAAGFPKAQAERDQWKDMIDHALRSGDEATLRECRALYATADGALQGWRQTAQHVDDLRCELLPDMDGTLPVTSNLPDRPTADEMARAVAEWDRIMAVARRARLAPPAQTSATRDHITAVSEGASGNSHLPEGFLSAAAIAERWKVPKNKRALLDQRLCRFRKDHGQDREFVVSVEAPSVRECRYLHSMKYVLPYIKDLFPPV